MELHTRLHLVGVSATTENEAKGNRDTKVGISQDNSEKVGLTEVEEVKWTGWRMSMCNDNKELYGDYSL